MSAKKTWEIHNLGKIPPCVKHKFRVLKRYLADRSKKVLHFVSLHADDPFPSQHLYLVHIWTIPRMLMFSSLQYLAAKLPSSFHTYYFTSCQQEARCFI